MKYIIVGIIIAVLIFLGYFLFSGSAENLNPNISEKNRFDNSQEINQNSIGNLNEHTIEITSEGFSPSILIIKVGETVNFVNKMSSPSWPASDIHPTHTIYPGSDIKKCGTSEEIKLFDACKGILRDEIYSFTFNEKGSWNYHDHLNPRLKGKIIVE
ncbi:MAG: hypothetical protein QW727_02830 [Candidatus Pacearchaeota archaeon]